MGPQVSPAPAQAPSVASSFTHRAPTLSQPSIDCMQHQKAKVSLLDSEQLYMEHKSSLADDAFESLEQVEAQYTLTQYYLAQVHGHLGESEDAARCCATTLRRQLPAGQCDREEWATNCMHLSSYYVANADFGRAKHCLDAAVHMMPDEAEQPAQGQGRPCLSAIHSPGLPRQRQADMKIDPSVSYSVRVCS